MNVIHVRVHVIHYYSDFDIRFSRDVEIVPGKVLPGVAALSEA